MLDKYVYLCYATLCCEFGRQILIEKNVLPLAKKKEKEDMKGGGYIILSTFYKYIYIYLRIIHILESKEQKELNKLLDRFKKVVYIIFSSLLFILIIPSEWGEKEKVKLISQHETFLT